MAKTLMLTNAAAVWGYLQFKDGTGLDLDGQTLAKAKEQVNGRVIKGYGHKDLGDEAHIYVVVNKKKTAVVTGVRNVKKLFRAKGGVYHHAPLR